MALHVLLGEVGLHLAAVVQVQVCRLLTLSGGVHVSTRLLQMLLLLFLLLYLLSLLFGLLGVLLHLVVCDERIVQ